MYSAWANLSIFKVKNDIVWHVYYINYDIFAVDISLAIDAMEMM